MRSVIFTLIFSAPFWWSGSASDYCHNSYTPATGTTTITVFTGRTPCGRHVRNFLGISGQTDCEMIRWELSLYQDEKLAATHFQLNYNYGMNQPNTEEFTGGGNPSAIKGVWKTMKGTKTDPDAIVCQLESRETSTRMALVRLNDDVIHLLDSDRGLMIGNASYSYTLYRIKD